MTEPLLAALVDAKALSPADAARALDRQREVGGAIDSALLELELAGDDRVAAALSAASGLPLAPPTAFTTPDPRGRRVFPAKVAERHGIAPFAMEGRELSVVTTHPPDLGLLDEISFMLSLQLRPHVAPEWQVRSLVQQLYGAPLPERLAALAARATPAPTAVPELELGSFAPVDEAEGAAPETRPVEAPVAAAAPAPLPPQAPRSGPWTPEEAAGALARAPDRDAVIDAALGYASDFFEFAAVLVVGRERIAGHDARGGGEEGRAACRAVSVPLDGPAVLRTPLESRAPYLGPPAGDDGTAELLAALRRRDPRTVLVHPVFVRDRPVCLLYADNGDAPVSASRLGDLFLFLGSVGPALERVILRRKTRTMAAVPPTAAVDAPPPGEPLEAEIEPGSIPDVEPWTVQEPARVPGPVELPLPPDEDGFVVASLGEALSPDRLLDLPSAVADLAASAPGSERRANLVAALSRRGPEAAAALVGALPGPVDAGDPRGARAPVEAQGPIPAAIAALGPAARRPLTVTLSAADVVSRRLAVQLLGRLGEAAPLERISACVFDEAPEVSEAACESLAALAWHPAMPATLQSLRAELGGGEVRAAQAARALARAGDVAAIPLLVPLLDRGGDLAAAAEQSLTRIALRRIGGDAARWGAWWASQRGASRIHWALEALTGPDRELRQAAAEDLRRVAPPPVPYDPDAPSQERARAARAWADLWLPPGATPPSPYR